MQRTVAVLLSGIVLTLTGCATLSENQCAASDWETIGYRDGLNGIAAAQLLKHQKACLKHGVIPDRETYLIGWNQGVVQYCRPENGFSLGQQGGTYPSICPAHQQDAFHAAYQDGRQLHIAQTEIAQLSLQISKREQRLQQIRTELTALDIALNAAETATESRLELLDKKKLLAQERAQLGTEMQELKAEVAMKSERLSSLRTALAYVAY